MIKLKLATSNLLRFALVADAIASGATGLLLASLSVPLAGLFALPQPLLFYAGIFLLPYAGMVAYVGTRANIVNWAAGIIVALNLLWVADSMLVLFSSAYSSSLLGGAFVLAQAAVVLALSIAQWIGIKQQVRDNS